MTIEIYLRAITIQYIIWALKSLATFLKLLTKTE